MESQEPKLTELEDKKKNRRLAKGIGAFAAGTAAVVGSYIAFGPDAEQAPKPATTTTVEEAPSTTSITETTPSTAIVESEEGPTSVIATPENPVETETPTTASVEGEDGPTSVVATPENPVETPTPTGN